MIRLTVDSLPELNLTVEEMRIIEAVSPVVSLERTEEGALLIVKDVNGTHQALIYDGQKGDPGIKGDPGNDGYSPVVSVQDIEGGHRITIEDSTGQHSFDVMNGDTGTGIVSIQKTGTAGLVDTYTITLSNGQTATFTVTNGQDGQTPTVPVQDVHVDGTSILDTQGVANVPFGSSSAPGVVKFGTSTNNTGILIDANGIIKTDSASVGNVKEGVGANRPIVPNIQHRSVFYGLATAAGDTTQRTSSNSVGNYTESAKSAISQMLDAPVSVSGTTPVITALPGVRYICGEVSTLEIIVPASGIIDVQFDSGATATVLTITPPTGQTVRWMNGFDPTSLDADTTYEINIADCLGVAGSWT